MENYVENRVKTLITLNNYEYKVINLLSKYHNISISKLISQMIEYYCYNREDWILPSSILANGQKNQQSRIIKELREKWKAGN